MSTKPKVARFFLRRVERPAPPPDLATGDLPFSNDDDGFGDQDFRPPQPSVLPEPAHDPAATEAALAAIAAEGLTGRQLRRARLMAQKHQIAFSSDLHAVLELRRAGIDPFSQSTEGEGQDTADAPPRLAAVPNASAPPSDPGRALTRLPGERAQLPGKARQ